MTKTNKSTAMIRRRRQRPTSVEFNKARNKTLTSPFCDDKNDHQQSVFYSDIVGSSTIQRILSSDKTIFLSLFVVRLVNAMLIQTFFVPDEFWQSVEVAHKMVFNYGYLTWEWHAGIRSFAYPLIFAALYQVLGLLGLDNRLLLIRMPRLLQSVLASTGDLFLFRLSRRLAGTEVAQWTLLCHMLSWFTAYCCTRTLTNSAETVLVTAALFYFPWPGYVQNKRHTRRFVWLAAASVVVRPTAGILWLLLCSWHLQQCKGSALCSTLQLYVTAGLTVLGLAAVIDCVWYGKWVFVHLNFLYFNVMTGGSAFYGSHSWHWYFTQGLPVVLGSHLLPFLLGARHASNKVLLLLIVWTVGILSFLSHKEMRFLLPVLPLAMHYCGVFFYNMSVDCVTSSSLSVHTDTEKKDDIASDDRPKRRAGHSTTGDKGHNSMSHVAVSCMERHGDQAGNSLSEPSASHRQRVRKVKYLVLLLALSNLLPLLYFSLIHQRGTIDVMNYLHDAVLKASHNSTSQTSMDDVDVLFLMPCHSTPFYSFIHVNISMRFLTCEPNLHHVDNYTDEADGFFEDPEKWLTEEFNDTEQNLPTHIVYFSCLQDHIHHFLRHRGYRQCAKFFHTHIPEGQVGSHVMVSCR